MLAVRHAIATHWALCPLQMAPATLSLANATVSPVLEALWNVIGVLMATTTLEVMDVSVSR